MVQSVTGYASLPNFIQARTRHAIEWYEEVPGKTWHEIGTRGQVPYKLSHAGPLPGTGAICSVLRYTHSHKPGSPLMWQLDWNPHNRTLHTPSQEVLIRWYDNNTYYHFQYGVSTCTMKLINGCIILQYIYNSRSMRQLIVQCRFGIQTKLLVLNRWRLGMTLSLMCLHVYHTHKWQKTTDPNLYCMWGV